MAELAQRLVRLAGTLKGSGNPLEITHELAASYQSAAEAVAREHELREPFPRLAQLVSASPLEAAIHDAQGKALGENSYNLLGPEFVSRDLAAYLTPEFADELLELPDELPDEAPEFADELPEFELSFAADGPIIREATQPEHRGPVSLARALDGRGEPLLRLRRGPGFRSLLPEVRDLLSLQRQALPQRP